MQTNFRVKVGVEEMCQTRESHTEGEAAPKFNPFYALQRDLHVLSIFSEYRQYFVGISPTNIQMTSSVPYRPWLHGSMGLSAYG